MYPGVSLRPGASLRRARDTPGYIEIHVYPNVSRRIPPSWSRCIPVIPVYSGVSRPTGQDPEGGIHRDTLGYICIPMYPVYPCVSGCAPSTCPHT